MRPRIPFNKPFIAGGELEHIADSVRGGHISGGGPYMKRCEEFLARTCGAHRVLLTTSCTAAMEMAAIMCGLEPGDEVILPPYTFVSTANAVLLRGARPVFVDIRPDTKNLDENLVEAAITDRTKVLMPVHYAGIGCEMDLLAEIAARHGLRIIEDAAQGLGADYKGRPLGTIGDFGAFSFHETKNVICGEGGALLLNRAEDVERAEILREKGTDRAKFFRGEIDKYTWVDIGSSYISSDVLAAFLWGQLEQMDRIAAKRRDISDRYFEQLAPLAAAGLLELPVVPEHCVSNHHMFYALPQDAETRTALIAYLRERGINAVFHYVPLHSSPMGRQLGYEEGMFPVAEDVSARLLRLPFYYEFTEDEQSEVTTAITEFFGERS